MTPQTPKPQPVPLLDVRELTVSLPVGGELRRVVHDVSLTIRAGEAVGLIGESGSGKSMTVRAISRLLPRGARTTGQILFDGEDVLTMGRGALRQFRLHGASIIFQDPKAHINPVRTIGDFLCEILRTERGMSRGDAAAAAAETLTSVGIADGGRRLKQYPHELSGGMLQRVMIASALLAESKLILADEPTTALDVTTQAETMAILDSLRRERGLALLFITHDLELASAVCDRSAVMYAGSIVEMQRSEDLNDRPLHPYTEALLEARPSVTSSAPRLRTIPGVPRSGFDAPAGCAFADRCPFTEEQCTTTEQVLRPLGAGVVRCSRSEEIQALPTRDVPTRDVPTRDVPAGEAPAGELPATEAARG